MLVHHLVGVGEIAELLGVTRQRVDQLIASYDDFPAPEVELKGGRVWSREAVDAWLAAHPVRPRTGRPRRAPAAGLETGSDTDEQR